MSAPQIPPQMPEPAAARESTLLFKYVSPNAVPKVLEHAKELSIRFGLPKTYNDPYELFLEPKPPLETEDHRAFYDFFLGRVVESPVACFSRRPEPVVMWAHYGRDGTGVCLALDEDTFVDHFPIAYVGDVVYSKSPATVPSDLVEFAYVTGKRRHTLRLIEVGRRAAYFTKRADWEYEAERRVVVPRSAVNDREGTLIGRVSPGALRYIILGPKVTPEVEKLCRSRAKDWGVTVIQLRIGTRAFSPFFTGPDMPAGVWSGTDFKRADEVCGDCGEPAHLLASGKCEWCDVSAEAKHAAPNRSMLVITLSLGIDKGPPFVFDGMEPRGRLAGKSTEPNGPAAEAK